MRTLVPALGLAALAGAIPAQIQLGDINPATAIRGSAPRAYVTSGPLVFFGATTGLGTELWASDGSATGTRLTRDIWPGKASSLQAGGAADLDGTGRLVFYATDPSTGSEPWVSDGSAAGTRLLRDIAPGTQGSQADLFVRVGTSVFFAADDGTSGAELWVTDGTAAGTRLVLDLEPGPAGALAFSAGVAYRGLLVFSATTTATGTELWVSDGTAAGTRLLADIATGSASSAALPLLQAGPDLYFEASVASGSALWKTDATTAGPVMVAPLPHPAVWGVDLNGTLLLRVGADLWRSNGTAASTQAITTTGVFPGPLVALGSAAFFLGSGGLWRTDGTTAGTQLLINPAPPSGRINNLIAIGNTLLFGVADTSDYQLWTSNGTAAGTSLLTRLGMGINHTSLQPSLFAWPQRQGAVFTLNDPSQGGAEPWFTDATAAGTARIADVAPPSGQGSGVTGTVNLNGYAYFAAFDPALGSELWRADANGAQLVADLFPGPGGSIPRFLTVWRGALYFSAEIAPQQRALYRSDGTVAGTVAIAGIEISSPPVEFGGSLYFGGGPLVDFELWKTDGSAAGTVRVLDLEPGTAGSAPAELTVLGNRMFFAAQQVGFGRELWTSDGTSAGTVRVADFVPGSGSFAPTDLTTLGNQLLFSATTAGLGRELWALDPATLQIQLLLDANPGPPSSAPDLAVVVGGRLFFTAMTPSIGTELWVTDGTPGGTQSFDLHPGTAGSSPRDLVGVSSGILFTAANSAAGREIWHSDGTAAGTQVVVQTQPGPLSGAPRNLARVGINDSVLFAADLGDGEDEELMLTDGTQTGTRRVANLNPFGDSAAQVVGRLGRTALFVADDGLIGIEPWALDLASIGAAIADPYGTGCAARSGSVPVLGVGSAPTLGNTGFAFVLDAAPTNQPAVIVLGTQQISTPVPAAAAACRVLAGGAFVLLPTNTNSGGHARTSVPIPNLAALRGIALFGQGAVADPRPSGVPLALSNGVQLLVGS